MYLQMRLRPRLRTSAAAPDSLTRVTRGVLGFAPRAEMQRASAVALAFLGTHCQPVRLPPGSWYPTFFSSGALEIARHSDLEYG